MSATSKMTKYKGVCEILKNGRWGWFRARHQKNRVIWESRKVKTAREAAIHYDMRLIELGLEPIHILKRK